MADDRSDERKAKDFAELSEPLQRASMDLSESINELTAYYSQLGASKNPFEWLKAIDRCARAATIISEKFSALKLAVLSEPYKP